MNYPYPTSSDDIYPCDKEIHNSKEVDYKKKQKLEWHLKSGALNHHNFTNMALFVLNDADRQREIKILDYGGGGGQFALVVKSLFPLSQIYLVDIIDYNLLDQFKPLNHQIMFKEFISDDTLFDVIFMNDVLEHVNDPLCVLELLRKKLVDSNGRIFVDTPCQFWIYPITKLFSKKLHTKVLRGTVDYDHQQIWSKSSFRYVVNKAGLRVEKYLETSEFTQGAEFYLDNMHIDNPALRLVGKIFYRLAKLIAKNKIMTILKPSSAFIPKQ